MLLSVSILCYNKSDYTKECLSYLEKSCGNRDDIQFIITDNASSDDTLEVISQSRLKNKVVLANKENLGFGGGHNHALQYADGTYFLVLNNDLFIYDNNWVPKLINAFDTDNVALVGLEGTPSVLNSEGHGRWGERRDYVEGSFLAGKTELFKKYGLFSPAIEMFLFEDSDLSLRYKQMGYEFRYIDIKHHHKHETSISTVPSDYKQRISKKNEAIVRTRWANYLKRRKFNNKIVIRFNSWGIGDAVCGTSAIEALRKDHPTAEFHVETYFPKVFEHNPNVQAILEFGKVDHSQYDRFVDMNLGQARDVPQWKVYEELALTKIVDPFPKLYFSEEENEKAEERMTNIRSKYDFVIGCGLLMARVEWQGRNWNHAHINPFLDIMGKYTNDNFGFLLFGRGVPRVKHPNAIDLVDEIDLRMFFALMHKVDFFVGIDSLPMHVAQAARVPGVVMFGATDPSTRLIEPSKLKPLYREDLACKFCYTTNHMSSNLQCRHRTQSCMFKIMPRRLADTVVQKLREDGTVV